MIITVKLVLLVFYISLKSGYCELSSNGPFVRKGLGKKGKYYEDFSTCVTVKTDFIFYDVGLYPNEYVNISCGSGNTLKPIGERKYFKSSEYLNPLEGPVEVIDNANTGLIDVDIYGIKYNRSGDNHTFHYESGIYGEFEKSFYFHCYNYLDKPLSTIKINLIPALEANKNKPIDFEFDKLKYSRDGKDLTYIKSVRPGALTTTKCNDSKLTVKYTGRVKFDENNYSPIKKMFNTDIEYKDISREFITEKNGVHTIDLTKRNNVLTDAERCKTIITCAKHPNRKLIYVNTSYHGLKGLHSKTEEPLKPLEHTDSKEQGFILNTKDHDSLFVNIPYGNTLIPEGCPDIMESISNGSQETIQNLKITKITPSMSLLDLSSLTNYKRDYLSCKASKTIDGKKTNMVLEVNPTCDFSERTSDQPENFCSLFSDLRGTVVVKASAKELSKLNFANSFYSRNKPHLGKCRDCKYTKLVGKTTPKIEKHGNKVLVSFKGDKIDHNPVYLISTERTDPIVNSPVTVIEIYLTDAKTFIKYDTVNTHDKVSDVSKFYHVNIDKESINIDCRKFFSNPKQSFKPVLYPKGDNMVFKNVPNGSLDPSGLAAFAIHDLFKIHGYNFIKSNESNMKIVLNNHFMYSRTPKPIYFICGHEDDRLQEKKPYAVIAIDPNYKNMDEKLCGIYSHKQIFNNSENRMMCRHTIHNETDFYPFYCPYKETGIKPTESEWLFKLGTNITYVSCKDGVDGKYIEKEDFYDYMYNDPKNIRYSNVILFNKKTPLFKKGITTMVICMCKGPDFESIIEITNGFLSQGIKIVLLPLVLVTIYNL